MRRRRRRTRIISRDDSSSRRRREERISKHREREREKERSAQKSNSRFVFIFWKKFHLFFPAKTLCAAWARTPESKSLPFSTAHQSSIHRPLWARYVVKNRSNPPVFDRLECVCLVKGQKDRKETSDRARVEEEYTRWSSEIARKGRNFRRLKKGHERTEQEETNKKFERENREKNREKKEKGVKRRVIGNGIQRDRGDKKRRAMADVAKRRGHSTTENLDSTHVRFVIRFIWS